MIIEYWEIWTSSARLSYHRSEHNHMKAKMTSNEGKQEMKRLPIDISSMDNATSYPLFIC